MAEIPNLPPVSSLSQLDTFMAAIRRLELGSFDGKYDAVNKRSGALGAYQIMPSNWSWWTQKWGVSGADWRDQRAQDYVARKQFEEYFAKYGRWDLVAIAWFAGPGRADRARREGLNSVGAIKDAMGTSVSGYVGLIRRYMDEAPSRYKRGQQIRDLIDGGLPPADAGPTELDPFTPDVITPDEQLRAFLTELEARRESEAALRSETPHDRRRMLLTNTLQMMSRAVRAGANSLNVDFSVPEEQPTDAPVPEDAPVIEIGADPFAEDDDA